MQLVYSALPTRRLRNRVTIQQVLVFADGSYAGMIPTECSSGERQWFGALTKQGNPLLPFLRGEAAAYAARRDPELQRFYRRKLVQRRYSPNSFKLSSQPTLAFA